MISFHNVSLHFGERKLFDKVSFLISHKDRVGLVGNNGAGKTTLLKVIVKQASIDEGTVVVPRDITIGYLPQHIDCIDSCSVMEEAMKAFPDLHHLEKEIENINLELKHREDFNSEDYLDMLDMLAEKTERLNMINAATAKGTAEKTLLGLGFLRPDLDRPTREFSGGWRMRIEIAKILLRAPDIFLLDEPTNHLDIESIQWLENFLKQYHGAVVLISHDKAFLDNVTTRTIEISLGRITDYRVPYSKYVLLRKEKREQQLAAYRNQQKQLEETREFIERFRYKATKAVQVQSRIKQLGKIEIIEIDEEDQSTLSIKFPPAPRSGINPLKIKELTKKYEDHTVLNKIDLIVERGERIAFIGRNGEGKTTLARIITGSTDFTGQCQTGHNITIGYYAQNQEDLLDADKTVLQTIDEVAKGDIRTKIRDILGAFLFRGEDVDKKVRVLSGGEKSRLAFTRLLLEPYNLLVLDEPTNHLDMRSKEILKQALKNYDGTLIIISHDREFLSDLTDKLYYFKGGKIKEFRGDIFEFLRKQQISSLDELNRNTKKESSSNESKESDQKKAFQERKTIDREIRRISVQIKETEEEIMTAEDKIAHMNEQMTEGTAPDKSQFYHEYEDLKTRVSQLMNAWEELHKESNALEDKRNSVI